jgi:two-component system OmpR family response regulator
MAVQVHSPRGACAAAPALKARGLAVWVTPGDGEEIDDAVMARAAELLLARALRIAPEAEVHVWPAAGAATYDDGANDDADGSGADGDDDGAPLPPSTGPASHVAVDLAKGEVLLDGQRVPLTGVEFKLLRYLVENCSRAISREELRLFLESFDFPGAASRSIDVYVGRVRRKLHRARHAIATVRGGGYQFIPGPYAKVRGPAEYCI